MRWFEVSFHEGGSTNFFEGCGFEAVSRGSARFHQSSRLQGGLGSLREGSKKVTRAAGHEGSIRVPSISSRAGVVCSEEGSTRVPPEFCQGSARAAGWSEVVSPARRAPDEGSTRVPPSSSRVRRGSTRVVPGFRGPGWIEVMFHENFTRIPGFAR